MYVSSSHCQTEFLRSLNSRRPCRRQAAPHATLRLSRQRPPARHKQLVVPRTYYRRVARFHVATNHTSADPLAGHATISRPADNGHGGRATRVHYLGPGRVRYVELRITSRTCCQTEYSCIFFTLRCGCSLGLWPCTDPAVGILSRPSSPRSPLTKLLAK